MKRFGFIVMLLLGGFLLLADFSADSTASELQKATFVVG